MRLREKTSVCGCTNQFIKLKQDEYNKIMNIGFTIYFRVFKALNCFEDDQCLALKLFSDEINQLFTNSCGCSLLKMCSAIIVLYLGALVFFAKPLKPNMKRCAAV